MKKKNIIIIAIISIILILVFGYVVVKNIRQKNREYEIEKIGEYKYFVLKENDKYGVIDDQGNKIIEAQYNNVKIPNPTKAVFFCEEEEDTKILNEKSEELYEKFGQVELLKLKNVSSDLVYEKSVLRYSKDGKYGLVDFEGKKITNPIYEEIDTLQFKEGELVVKKDGKYGIINIKGAVLVKVEYDKIEADKYYDENQGYKKSGYIVSITTDEGYRYGYINVDADKLLDTKYNELYRIAVDDTDKIYIVCAENGQYGLYKDGKEVISNDYQSLNYDERSGLLVVAKGKRYGVMAIDGSVKVPFQYNQIDITGEYIYATNSEGTKVLDKSGKETDISKDIAIINIHNTDYKIYIETTENKTKYSLYKSKERKTSNEYTYIEYLYENYFIVCNINGKLGIIDIDEKVKVPLKYNTIKRIGDTELIQAEITDTKLAEVYSKEMVKICELQNALIQENDNYIKVYNNNEIIYVSKYGKTMQNTEVFINNTIFAKQQNGKWGYVDLSGNVVVDYKYDKVTEVNQYGFASICLNDKWGVIDRIGNIVIEPTYEIKTENEPSFIGQYYQVVYGNGEIYYTK